MFQTKEISDLKNLIPSNAENVLLEHFTEILYTTDHYKKQLIIQHQKSGKNLR